MLDRRVFLGLIVCGMVFLASGCSNPFGNDEPPTMDLLLTGMEGWEVVNGPEYSWMYSDGMLYTDGKTEGDGNWISTKNQYADFLLELEFNIAKEGNSGVFIRAPRTGDPAYEGIEIQILDDRAAGPNLKPWQFTGAIYDVAAPLERVTKKAGQWQTMVICCRENLIKVQVNGNTIIDMNLDEAQSMSGRPHPGLTRGMGYIGFQNHKSPVKFRNIRITELVPAL